jgi:hypothetical protein
VRHAVDQRERCKHDGYRAAQARPTEQNQLARREPVQGGRDERGERPGHEDEDQSECRSLEPDVAQLAREHEQAQRKEHRDLCDPREPVMEDGHRLLGGDAPGAEDQAGEVCGKEAGAVQRGCPAKRQSRRRERRHRVEARAREPRAAQRVDGE